jgi:4-hydroxythreonine-4-phosphate dehydrogenase
MMLYLPPRWKNENIEETSNDDSDAGAPMTTSGMRGGAAGLGVVHVTLHMALREVFEHLNEKSIFATIELAQNTFTKLRTSLGLPPCPALAVAALNPHCGEGGLFGDEETRLIAPAVSQARALGWNVSGPLSVDTLMPAAAAGRYDAVIAMYHDQGHIALKLLDMFDAVNITLGIPIIRTSVAHGTAHDIAWQGIAKSSGMTQAILTAVRLARGTQVVSHTGSSGV